MELGLTVERGLEKITSCPGRKIDAVLEHELAVFGDLENKVRYHSDTKCWIQESSELNLPGTS